MTTISVVDGEPAMRDSAQPQQLLKVVDGDNAQAAGPATGAAGIEKRIIGDALLTRQLREAVAGVSAFDAHTIVIGDTGVGKELVARCLHRYSCRAEAPFVAINCGAVPEHLLESELFGHEKGAFTGAQKRRTGKLEHASDGVLLFDEIESMPPAFQVKLLRVLQENTIERLGSNASIPINPRVICATKVDLKALVEAGKFRADLYYRLNIAEIAVPALSRRIADVPLLFEYFLEQAEATYGVAVRRPSAAETDALRRYSWPGNIRELKNTAHRFAIESTINGGGIDSEFLRPGAYQAGSAQGRQPREKASLAQSVRLYEKQLIREALQRHAGCIQKVLRDLDINRRTLNVKMQQYGLKRGDFLRKDN